MQMVVPFIAGAGQGSPAFVVAVQLALGAALPVTVLDSLHVRVETGQGAMRRLRFLAASESRQACTNSWTSFPVPMTANRRSNANFGGNTCFRNLADFEEEATRKLPPSQTIQTYEEQKAHFERRGALYVEAVTSERQCDWFERYRPGLSFEGHLELKHRREEWRRAAIVALVAAIIGGMIATLPTILFGHGVTIIIGR